MLGDHHVSMNIVHAMPLRIRFDLLPIAFIIIFDQRLALLQRPVGGKPVEIDTLVPGSDGGDVFPGEARGITAAGEVLGIRALNDARVDMLQPEPRLVDRITGIG